LVILDGLKELEWWTYLDEKKFDDIFRCIDTIHCDRQTDGHVGQTWANS